VKLKRLFDIVLATTGLVITAPVILLGAVAVRATSPGPAFYLANRAGLRGEPFHVLKLRTMQHDQDPKRDRITAENDSRVTPVGRLLRTFKIDELPQLWNILRGDMSFVGPRPEDLEIVRQHYSPEQMRVLDVRPGLTTPGQVEWYPDLLYHDPPPPGTGVEEHYLARHLPFKVAQDLEYVDSSSLLLDIRVLCGTLWCVAVRSRLALPPRKPLPIAADAVEGQSPDASAEPVRSPKS
jgi:lipopolysaccharide/colanic/teichoic acid biosynthesis glycosyltransferase